jgi:hypothetical protein
VIDLLVIYPELCNQFSNHRENRIKCNCFPYFSEPEALNEEENIDVISQKTNSDSVEIETEETADGKFMMVGDSQENKASKRRDIMSHLHLEG